MTNITKTHSTPLANAEINITFSLPIISTTLSQHFFNDTDTVIEACYQFPIPREGVLGNINVMVGGKKYEGQISERHQAQLDYEDTIAEGKRAVILQDVGDGLYELNIGNLGKSETATIDITIHQIAHITMDTVRYHFPTVITPHYGERNFNDLIEPKANFFANYPFTAVADLPKECRLKASSHPMSHQQGQMNFSGFLNQDISFEIETLAPESLVLQTTLDDDFISLGFVNSKSLQNQNAYYNRPLQVLVDCSGSMVGTSIEHVKHGLEEAFLELPASRPINLIRYGTKPLPLHCAPKPICRELNEAVKSLEANMGGTQIDTALELALNQLLNANISGDILLLTDGQVWEHEKIYNIARKAARADVRIFCIGVGYAISESVLQTLSDQTHASLSRVNPHERMADTLARVLFQSATPSSKLNIEVPTSVTESYTPQNIFSHHSACFALLSSESVKNTNIQINDEHHSIEGSSNTSSLNENAVRQIAAKLLIDKKLRDDKRVAQIAIAAGIVSPRTSFVMCSEDSVAGADGMPAVVQTPQMHKQASSKQVSPSLQMPTSPQQAQISPRQQLNESTFLDIPSFLRRQTDDGAEQPKPTCVHSATYAHSKEELMQVLQKIDNRLNRRHQESMALSATLSYSYLQSLGFSLDEIKDGVGCNELNDCAIFILNLAGDWDFQFTSRVNALLRHHSTI